MFNVPVKSAAVSFLVISMGKRLDFFFFSCSCCINLSCVIKNDAAKVRKKKDFSEGPGVFFHAKHNLGKSPSSNCFVSGEKKPIGEWG